MLSKMPDNANVTVICDGGGTFIKNLVPASKKGPSEEGQRIAALAKNKQATIRIQGVDTSSGTIEAK
jgi:hypothetical protein